MADALTTMSSLPYELQVKILEEMSGEYEMIPLEINGVVYTVPCAVIDLIEGLNHEIMRCRMELDAISKN